MHSLIVTVILHCETQQQNTMRLITLFLICILSAGSVYADRLVRGKLIRKTGTLPRPTKPSKFSYIDYEYEDGCLSILFPEGETGAHVSIYDYTNLIIAEEEISTNSPQIYINLTANTYLLKISTNNYGTFEGYITITN